MQRWARRTLPNNLSPVGTRCIQITIPDDDDWERDLYAEFVTLAQWMRWERDIGHNGKPVSDIWLKALRTWKHCDGTPSPIRGMEIEDDMPLRIDCDCNVFVTCCDGTEKQILTSDQVQNLINTSPTGGVNVPKPGACATYPIQLEGGKAALVAPIVNTGDILTLHNVEGATTDVAPVGRWNCPDGLQFFGGACVGTHFIDGTAPAPTLPIGIPLFVIAGIFYDGRTAFTVPSGVTNQLCAVIINYPSGGTYSGKLTGTLRVCNNTAVPGDFSVTFVNGTGPASVHPGDTVTFLSSAATNPIVEWGLDRAAKITVLTSDINIICSGACGYSFIQNPTGTTIDSLTHPPSNGPTDYAVNHPCQYFQCAGGNTAAQFSIVIRIDNP